MLLNLHRIKGLFQLLFNLYKARTFSKKFQIQTEKICTAQTQEIIAQKNI